MQDFTIGYVFMTEIYNKVATNQFKQQTASLFTYKIYVSVEFAAVSLPVWEASEASKKFLSTSVCCTLNKSDEKVWTVS